MVCLKSSKETKVRRGTGGQREQGLSLTHPQTDFTRLLGKMENRWRAVKNLA